MGKMTKTPRIIFSVLINEKEYDVWDLEREHAGHNDVPTSWWLYYSDRMPEGSTPPEDSPNFVPYHKWINRRNWKIEIEQYNTSKYKWDEWSFSNGARVKMYCNNKLVYAFSTGGSDISFAMAKVQYLQVVLQESAGFDFFEPEKEDGRKIYWFGLAAKVKVWRHDSPWEIGIVPDWEAAGMTEKEWWSELENRQSLVPKKRDDMPMWEEDGPGKEFINWGDALNDKYIDWYRK